MCGIHPLQQRWRRRQGIFALAGGAAVVLLGVVPVPTAVRVPCALEAHEERVLRAEWPGFLTQVNVKNGDRGQGGQLLAVITNEELDVQVRRQELKIEECRARLRRLEASGVGRRPSALSPRAGRATPDALPEAQAEAYRLQMLLVDLQTLRQRQGLLTVRAPFDGQVIAPNLDRVKGRFLQLGEELFTIASLDRLRVVAVVDDADIKAIADGGWRTDDAAPADRPSELRKVRIKFRTHPKRVFEGTVERVHPAATHQPPPKALTNAAGGPVLLDPNAPAAAPEGHRTLLPWCRVDIVLETGDENRVRTPNVKGPDPIFDPSANDRPPVGATGTARFVVGHDPLGRQAYLYFRRLLQARFLVL